MEPVLTVAMGDGDGRDGEKSGRADERTSGRAADYLAVCRYWYGPPIGFTSDPDHGDGT